MEETRVESDGVLRQARATQSCRREVLGCARPDGHQLQTPAGLLPRAADQIRRRPPAAAALPHRPGPSIGHEI